VTWTFDDGHGNISTAEQIVIIEGLNPPTGAGSQTFCLGDNATIESLVTNEANVVWYDAAVGGQQIPSGTALVDGKLYYAARRDGSCESISRFAVLVRIEKCVDDFFIPNVFTPNGDGKNDAFEIVGISAFERISVTIINRWGNEVYRNENYDNSWTGRGLNDGTYYYVIVTYQNGKANTLKGWVLIKSH